MHLAIGGDAEQPDRQIIMLLHRQDRRHDHVRSVRPDDQVDLVDFNQLGVDARNERWIALIVVVDEFDRPSEQPALGVDVILPDLYGEQDLLAVWRHRAGQSDAEADTDWIGGGRSRDSREAGSIAAAANLGNARNRPTILIILTAHLPRSPSRGQDWKFAVESIDHRAIVGNADFATPL